MMKHFVLLTVFVVVAKADVPAAPQDPQQVYCGEIPNSIYACLGNPMIVGNDIRRKCGSSIKECDKMTCLFREARWLNADGKVNKEKLLQHLDSFAREHATWATAIQHAKTECLVQDLPAQGIELNCPAYDVMSCILASFIRNAQPSQWSTNRDCAYAKQFAGACPICPTLCFASAIPTGSCNACRVWPRSP